MGKTFIIDIPQETANYLQRLAFEVSNYRDNLAYLLDTRRNDAGLMDSIVYKKYQDLTLERSAEYEMAKTEVVEQLVPDGFIRNDVLWEMDYKWNELRITAAGEHNLKLGEKLGLQAAEDENA